MSNIRIDVTANVQGAVTGLNQVRKATQTTSAAINSATTNMRKINGQVTTSQKNFRKFAMGGMQQAGYQIGDYAVQVANGTSKMQAFGQQAPQLLQIFGPIGAIVGAGVAIFAAFGVAVQRSGKQVENASAAFGVLAEPIMAVKDAIIGLKASFGSALPAIASNLDTAIIAAGLFAAVTGVKMVRSMLMASGSSTILAAAMVNVRAAVLASALSAGAFSKVMVTLRAATLLTGAALKAVGSILMRFLPIAILLGVAKLVEMFLQLRRGAGSFAEAIRLLGDVAKEIFQRISLRGWKMYATLQIGIKQFKVNFLNALIPMAEGFDRFAAGFAESWNSMFPEESPLDRLKLTVGTGFANELEAATSEINGEIKDLQAGLATANEALSKPMTSIEAIRAAFAAGADDAIVFGASLDDVATGGKTAAKVIKDEVTPAMERLKSVQESVSSAIENGMMSMVDGTQSVKEAFKSMASAIIKDLYRIFVVKKITGFISDAIGAKFGPAVPATPALAGVRAMGGQVTGGKAYMVGERGPEVVVPSRNGHVVPNNQAGGGSGVTIIQNNTFGAGVSRTEIGAMLPKIVEASKAAVLDARRRGGSYAGAF